jgi:DNA-binding CsgD family transcriptional regulator
MSSQERMLAVIEAFYDAALDETRWPSALQQLTDVGESQAASFWVLDGSQTPRLPTFICLNVDPAAVKEYLDYAAPIDPTVQYLIAHPHQPIVHDGLVISESEKDRHPYYDWHDRRIDTRFRMVGQAQLMPSVQAGVALHRARKTGRYETTEIETFAVLHRHLQRALTIGVRIGSLGAKEEVSKEWLDRCGSAVLLLDHRRRIVFTNRAAQALDMSDDGIRFSVNGIALANKHDHGELQALIAQALSSKASRGPPSGGSMRARRPSGKRPFGIFVSPLSREFPALALFRPALCIVITDPEHRPLLPVSQLQAAFDLTEAEARLAGLLANGEELRRAAEQLKITYGTARTRLAQIFQKTDTRRQAELVRLLISLAAL